MAKSKNMSKFAQNKFLYALIAGGVILFAIIAFVIISFTTTVKAVVPNQTIPAGTKIDASMLQTIDVPSNTPGNGQYLTNAENIIGQKLKVTVDKNQLIYIHDVMTSFSDFTNEDIPDDYIITTINIPSNRAVGGLITAGDTVDLLGIPKTNYATIDAQTMANNLGAISETSYGANGEHVYWILANVKVLETDSTLSQSQDSSISNVTAEDDSNSDGANYVVALSYSDYKKLRLAEQYLDMWMNIAPVYNEENGPMLELMTDSEITTLMDAQGQSIINKKNEQEKKSKDKSKKSKDTSENKENTESTENAEAANSEDAAAAETTE